MSLPGTCRTIRRRATGALVLAALTAGGSPPAAPAARATAPARAADRPLTLAAPTALAPAALGGRRGWVGRVAGTPAFVGLVAGRGTATAYVCDGRRIARWYAGALHGRRATLRDARGRRLTVRFTGRRAVGRVRLAGRGAVRFAAVRARGRAGVFRRERAERSAGGAHGQVVEGWVRLNDGRTKGLAARSALRVRRPAAGVEVFLLPEGRAARRAVLSGPPAGTRVAPPPPPGPCFTIPRAPVDGRERPPLVSGSSCGLPETGMRLGNRRTTARVTGGTGRFTKEVLDQLLQDLSVRREADRARLARLAGLPAGLDDLVSPAIRRRLEDKARAMIADKELTTQADRLRSPGTPADREAQMEALARLGGKYLDPELGRLVDRPEIAALETAATGTTNFTHVQRVEGEGGGFPVWDFRTLEGPDAQVTGVEFPVNIIDHFEFGLRAHAGFNSRAEFDVYAGIDVVLPPGTQAATVEVVLNQSVDLDTTEGCLDGQAWGSTSLSLDLYAMSPGGFFDLANDPPVVSRHQLFPWSVGDTFIERLPSPYGFLFCHQIVPPTPPFPYYLFSDIVPDAMAIPDPAAGGSRFLLVVGAHGIAQTFTDAQAWAEHEIRIDEVVIRSS
jgi:hypothetical protein